MKTERAIPYQENEEDQLTILPKPDELDHFFEQYQGRSHPETYTGKALLYLIDQLGFSVADLARSRLITVPQRNTILEVLRNEQKFKEVADKNPQQIMDIIDVHLLYSAHIISQTEHEQIPPKEIKDTLKNEISVFVEKDLSQNS